MLAQELEPLCKGSVELHLSFYPPQVVSRESDPHTSASEGNEARLFSLQLAFLPLPVFTATRILPPAFVTVTAATGVGFFFEVSGIVSGT